MRQGTGSIVSMSVVVIACAIGCADPNGTGDAGAGGIDAAVGTDAAVTRDAGRDARAESDAFAARDTGRDARTIADAGRDAFDPIDAAPEVDGGPLLASECLARGFATPPIESGPDYDRFAPTVGSHCLGTNHQDIRDVDRVVFLGDSVTVGTPPTETGDMYRNLLADRLATRFGLERPIITYDLWKTVDVVNGVSLRRDAGPFSSCARWGARTDDLLPEGVGDTEYQMGDCFPMDRRDEATLVIMTMGGNDIAALTKDGFDGTRTIDQLWDDTRAFVERLRLAVQWLREPGRFTAPVYIVFSNNYEFTDGTGDIESCPAADLGGFGGEWADPAALRAMVIWATEQYLSIAVEENADMIFLLEHFCGHGYHNDDPSAGCYRGPGTPRWFDLTCTHPNPDGHAQIADMFMAVVNE
ncbi:MAG: SGNH/GDSL hydrolase family protein [Deltaproteobacteria bacterium]|nr:SGNH/GDSL hydrolase family protein [Deltaproteobacteria bacterium]